eukprot:TRINITY_DN14461_c0_g3_i1.p2 TRINITY_DN14461_c0_g3~~TRINITY_DN14461_c0_g3_i1.p2  ORF type:complete len:102 (+),score=14.13 TRINITY_DN14461_c0_g3_i1:208-513(+)
MELMDRKELLLKVEKLKGEKVERLDNNEEDSKEMQMENIDVTYLIEVIKYFERKFEGIATDSDVNLAYSSAIEEGLDRECERGGNSRRECADIKARIAMAG